MKKQFLIIILPFILFCSCESNLDLDLDKNPSLLVLNALAAKDSLVKVHVSQSRALQKSIPAKELTSAVVQLFEGDKLMGSMQIMSQGWYQMDSRFESNKDYKIVVNHPDFKSINSKTTIPNIVPITGIRLEQINVNRCHFKLKFQDNEGSKDFYMVLLKGIYVFEKDGESIKQEVDFPYFSDDVVFNGNLLENTTSLERNFLLGSRAFSDKSFNGQEVEISFYADSFYSWDEYSELKIELYHISRDYYAYERSKIMIANREDLPFYKKINLHSNVNFGAGIFAGYALSSKILKSK